MASPNVTALNACTLDLSKGVETLVGSYFEAASCSVTGLRPNQEDAHSMLSFSLAVDKLNSNSTSLHLPTSPASSEAPPPTTTASLASSPVRTVFSGHSRLVGGNNKNISNNKNENTNLLPSSVPAPAPAPSSSPSSSLPSHENERPQEKKNPFASSLISSINKTYSCFGIFDGHGSADCSAYIAKELPQALQNTFRKFVSDLSGKAASRNASSSSTSSSAASLPVTLMMETKESRQQLEDRVIQTFHAVDKKYLEEELAHDSGENTDETFGTTAVLIVLEPNSSSSSSVSTSTSATTDTTATATTTTTTSSQSLTPPNKSSHHHHPPQQQHHHHDRHLQSTFSGTSTMLSNTAIQHQNLGPIVARAMICNLGDSRCMILRGGNVVFKTIDQKPDTPKEKERIEKCRNPLAGTCTLSGSEAGDGTAGGGFIASHYYVTRSSPPRINGVIGVARAFGDKPFKPYKNPNKDPVSCTPKIDFVDLYKNDVILLGCDGLFDGPMFAESHLVSHVTERVGYLAARYDLQFKTTSGGSPIGDHHHHHSSSNISNNSINNNAAAVPFATLATTCAEVCHRAISGGSVDNISSMLVRLSEDHLLQRFHGGHSRLARRRCSAGGAPGLVLPGMSAGAVESLQPSLRISVSGTTTNARRRSATTVGRTPEPAATSRIIVGGTSAASALPLQHAVSAGNFLMTPESSFGVGVNLTGDTSSSGVVKTARRRRASSVLANHPSQQQQQQQQLHFSDKSEPTNPSVASQQPAPAPAPGLSVGPKHQRSHSSQNFLNPSSSSALQQRPLSSRSGGGGAGGDGIARQVDFYDDEGGTRAGFHFSSEDPLLLINKLQTKFVAGPLPECDESWFKFTCMAKSHHADPSLAAQKRLRLLRAAHDEKELQRKLYLSSMQNTAVVAGNINSNINNNNNTDNNNNNVNNTNNSTPAGDRTASPHQLAQTSTLLPQLAGGDVPLLSTQFSQSLLPLGEQQQIQQLQRSASKGHFGLVVATANSARTATSPIVGPTVIGGGGAALGKAPPFNKNNSGNGNDNDDERAPSATLVAAAPSQQFVQQYAARLVASGDYTEEEIALLTCQQSPADLEHEFKKMLTILQTQREREHAEGHGADTEIKIIVGDNEMKGNRNINSRNEVDDHDDGEVAAQRNKLNSNNRSGHPSSPSTPDTLPSDKEWIELYEKFVQSSSVSKSQQVLKTNNLVGNESSNQQAQKGFADSFGSAAGGDSAVGFLAEMQKQQQQQRGRGHCGNGGGAADDDNNNILLLVTQQMNDNTQYDDGNDEEFWDEEEEEGGFQPFGEADNDDDDDDGDLGGGNDDDEDDEDCLGATVRRK